MGLFNAKITMVENKHEEKVLEREIKKQNSTPTFWIETLVSQFGFKCMMSKHDLCIDPKCQCLCH